MLTTWIAYYLRLGEFIILGEHSEWERGALLAGAVSISMALPIFIISGLYRAIFR